jgi:hypothetical protein
LNTWFLWDVVAGNLEGVTSKAGEKAQIIKEKKMRIALRSILSVVLERL